MTQIYIKQNLRKHRTQNFRRISPFGITPVEKAHKARDTLVSWTNRHTESNFYYCPGAQHPLLLIVGCSLVQRLEPFFPQKTDTLFASSLTYL